MALARRFLTFQPLERTTLDVLRIQTFSLFIDSTPVKAHANPNRRIKLEIEKETKSYEKKLQEEINAKREEDGKDPFDYDDGDETTFSTRSPVDPEAGMFIKGEHRRMFAYNLQVACDKRGWILDYSVCAEMSMTAEVSTNY